MSLATALMPPDLCTYLDAGPLHPSPSEAHGLLCGLLCGGAPEPLAIWLAQVAPAADAEAALRAEAQPVLRKYGTSILSNFQTADALVQLPIPDDRAALGERALWLYDWLRGFLYALGLIGVSDAQLSAQGREILRDLVALTQMDLDALEDSEENEQALAELIEFVRVAAMLIYHEQPARRVAPETPAV